MARIGPSFRSVASLRVRLPPDTERRRLGGLLLRSLAGIGGGYALAALATVVLSLSLPLARSEAVLAATMASFAVHAAAIIWAFAARSALRAVTGLVTGAALLTLIHLVVQGQLP
ncbi:DUF3649 domain-containing protein [Roseomonas sp. KE2513]|uniref:DUF3649 domain-containing protein n=1 Tax=Roseomonas sp. KE2513 TaxID=2479202 RepID=UPI0018DFB6E1|nr:DUF3649 domain-containing protein [Roseomonas sp. KE2513]